MIKSIKEKANKKPEIDLTGPDGNAFVLMGYAKRYAKQLGIDGSKVVEEMTSGDYEVKCFVDDLMNNLLEYSLSL